MLMRYSGDLAKRFLVSLMIVVVIILPFQTGSRITLYAADITLESSAKMSFPNSITFNVKAQSDANIVQLRLHYVVDMQNYADVVSEGWAQFTPARTVNTKWVWDMRKSGSLPVGMKVRYWWTAVDTAGKTAESAHGIISFDDTRFKWQSVIEDPVTIFWYDGDRTFIDLIMSAAQEGLQKIERDTGVIPQDQVSVYIYADTDAMQSGQLFAQEWEGGATYSGCDTIIMAASMTELVYAQGTVTHELTHWITDQKTFNYYGAGIPDWLSEGLATYGETPATRDYEVYLEHGIETGVLLSVRGLSSPFSADPTTALISYGESYSIVKYLINTYGSNKINQLLEAFHQGNTYDDALESVYGFNQDGLDSLWRQSLELGSASELASVLP